MNTRAILVISVVVILTTLTVVIAYVQYQGDIKGSDKIISSLSANPITTLGSPTLNINARVNTLTEFTNSSAGKSVYYQNNGDSPNFYILVSGVSDNGTPPTYSSIYVIAWTPRWDGFNIFGGSLLNP
jgi:hypothetical protein